MDSEALIHGDGLPTTPLVTCLSGALDGTAAGSLSVGWFLHYLDTKSVHTRFIHSMSRKHR
jgi:hypothetical protein